MKNLLLAAVFLMAGTTAFAKKVQFNVDMTGQTVSTNGLHVTGDFQTAAGYSGGNFDPATTSMVRQGATQIYSVTVSIPAFAAYQYKFVNGDQLYDAEFVPAESRVDPTINDNRWIYADSLGPDTLKIPAIMYGANAPSGLYLLRFKVDLRSNQPTAAIGAHVAGSFQGTANPATVRLYSFSDSVYQYITYVTAGTYSYKYYSGNTAGTSETVPAACATGSNRSIAVSADIVLSAVCFSSCSACNATGVAVLNNTAGVTVAPNPVQDYTLITFKDQNNSHNLTLTDVSGRTVYNVTTHATSQRIERNGLPSGIYFLRIATAAGTLLNAKLSFQ